MRVLHTADWHIGQTLNGWSREVEHQVWLDELAGIIAREEIDVLLVAGDVYDGINPSGESQRLLYSALRRFKDARPSLTTVISSGNHDPAGRLEAPGAILESLDVHVVASLRRQGEALDVAGHMIPLRSEAGELMAWACAIPFLRAADLPGVTFTAEGDRGDVIVEGARRFHTEMAAGAREIAGDLPILALGHLHCMGALESEGAERRILIGGEHAVPADIFPEAFDYVALGHLHRPQTLGDGRIRYSGSCFPLSAAEASYDHGATIIEIENGQLTHEHMSIPRPAPMIRIPQQGTLSFADFEEALAELEDFSALDKGLQPFLYVNLEATGAASVLLSDAEKLLAEYALRPASIRVRRVVEEDAGEDAPMSLQETTPEELFRKAFLRRNAIEPELRHLDAFREVSQGV